MAIARTLPTASLSDWKRNKPTMAMADGHRERVIKCAPAGWQAAIRAQFTEVASPLLQAARTDADLLATPPEWVLAWDLMQTIADFEGRYGFASLWNLSDYDICQMAKKLAAEADELDAICMARGDGLAVRVDSIRMLVRCVGITEDKPIAGEPSMMRAQDAAWWRKRLRVHVARVVEGGAVSLGRVHKALGGYVSEDGLVRRQAQIKRNAEALGRTLYRNEAGQVYTLAELAELGTANPIIRGGELMTRIRGAEEYADARGHVGLFLTLTLPSRFHPVKLGSGGRPIPNKKYAGATPRDGQLWLREMWAKVRAHLARRGVRIYGLRVAEPHHDATPHWHALLWAECEADAQAIEDTVRPLAHDDHAFLQHVGAAVGSFGLGVDGVRQAQFDGIARVVRGFACPVAEGGAEAVGHSGQLVASHQGGECHIRQRAFAVAWEYVLHQFLACGLLNS